MIAWSFSGFGRALATSPNSCLTARRFLTTLGRTGTNTWNNSGDGPAVVQHRIKPVPVLELVLVLLLTALAAARIHLMPELELMALFASGECSQTPAFPSIQAD